MNGNGRAGKYYDLCVVLLKETPLFVRSTSVDKPRNLAKSEMVE